MAVPAMRQVHFYKAHSRIGLTNAPIRQTDLNTGVEEGAEAVLTESFLSAFPEHELNEFSFSDPEKIDKDQYWKVLAKELSDFKNLINSTLKQDQTQLVIGGDNTVTFSSLSALIERVGRTEEIGYIQFDSHGEMHRYGTSLSKNFHGMYMRPFFDTFDIPEIEQLVSKKLKSSQAFAIGDITFDGEKSEEEEFFKQNIRDVTREEFLNNRISVRKEFEGFCKSFKYLHINFDVDVFDRAVAGATGIPEDGKWLTDEVMDLIKIIAQNPNLSIDISELNPKRPGAEQTIILAQKLLTELLA